MSVFRPRARVTAPDGRDWEIYAYRIQLPSHRRRRSAGLRLLGLAFLDVPQAALRSRRSDEWTIEAITWQPHRSSYTWTTTGEYRGHVLAQVEGELARGDVPRPHHATYLGASG